MTIPHPNPDPPSYVELLSLRRLSEAAAITSLSEDTLRARYARFIVQVSPRRQGMRLRDILAIAAGQVESTPPPRRDLAGAAAQKVIGN
jgi:hypothetical protein